MNSPSCFTQMMCLTHRSSSASRCCSRKVVVFGNFGFCCFRKRRFPGRNNSYAVCMRFLDSFEPVITRLLDRVRVRRLPLMAALIVLFLMGCKRPSETRSYPSPNGELSYRVDDYRGHGALDANSTGLFAVLQTEEGRSEKLVLSGTDVDLRSIRWKTENEGSLCLAGGYTETYRRIVALSVGSKTVAVYTHLSDSC